MEDMGCGTERTQPHLGLDGAGSRGGALVPNICEQRTAVKTRPTALARHEQNATCPPSAVEDDRQLTPRSGKRRYQRTNLRQI